MRFIFIITLLLVGSTISIAQSEISIYRTPRSWNGFVTLFLLVKGDRAVLVNRGCTGVMLSKGRLVGDSLKFKEPENLNANVSYLGRSVDSVLTVDVQLKIAKEDFHFFSKYTHIYSDGLSPRVGLDTFGRATFTVPVASDTIPLELYLPGYDTKELKIIPKGNNIRLLFHVNYIEFYREQYVDIVSRKGRFCFDSRGKTIRFRKAEIAEMEQFYPDGHSELMRSYVGRLFQE